MIILTVFAAMNVLDGDDVRLSSKGRYAERDIVQVNIGIIKRYARLMRNILSNKLNNLQFVPFNDFVDPSGNSVRSQARLAKEVLAEIPEQFLSYMKSRGFKPKPPINRQDSFALPVSPPSYDAVAAGARM